MTYQIEDSGGKCIFSAPHTGTVEIQNQLLARVKNTSNGGLYVCKIIRGSAASVSLHGVWRAGDVMCPSQTAETKEGLAIVALLILHAKELQIQRIIHAKKIWDCERGWHDFTGPDPHFNHVHWEVTKYGASLSTKQVQNIFAGSVPPTIPSGKKEVQNMYFAKKSDSGTVWLVVPGGKVGMNTQAEFLQTEKDLKAAGFNSNIVVFTMSSASNVGSFLDKLPVLG